MNDTDSLLVFRLQRLRQQPKTVRGRCILYYASLHNRPCMRTFIFGVFATFALAHTLAFCLMLQACYEDQQCSLSTSTLLWPLLLMSIYPIVFIPFILVFLFIDIFHKKEGLMVWHRNSIGNLIQRLFFSLIMMSSILTFKNCIDDVQVAEDLKQCLIDSGIPLIIVLFIVTLKVLCLRSQRFYLWTGFIICLVAQFIVFAMVDANIVPDPSQGQGGYDHDGDKITQCLMFLPSVTFGLSVDLQIIVSTLQYQPVAFALPPYKHSKTIMLVIGILSLLMSLISYAFCFIVFGGLSQDPALRKWVFICFIAKAVTWSPFLGLEFYDMILEQIYHDVQFQLNVIKPDNNSRTTSPRQDQQIGPHLNQKLPVIHEHSQEALMEVSEEENERSQRQQKANGRDQHYNSSLLQPTSTQNDQSSSSNQNYRASQENFKPVDVRTDSDVDDQIKNRLFIQKESLVTKSLTDNMGSMMDQRNRKLNLTEQERLIQQANYGGGFQRVASQMNSQIDPALQTTGEGGEPGALPLFASMMQDQARLMAQSSENNVGPQMAFAVGAQGLNQTDKKLGESKPKDSKVQFLAQPFDSEAKSASHVFDISQTVQNESQREEKSDVSENNGAVQSTNSQNRVESDVSINPTSLQEESNMPEHQIEADQLYNQGEQTNQDEDQDN